MEQMAVAVLLVWICVMCGLLIWMRDYKECVIGGVGMVTLIIACSVTLYDMYTGTIYSNFLPASYWVLTGIALVLTQHAFGHWKNWMKVGRKVGSKLFY